MVEFYLQSSHDFEWLKQMGEVFCVFDQQDSGNISFGVQKDGQKYFVKYAGAQPMEFSGNKEDAVDRLIQAVSVYESLKHPHLIKLLDHFSVKNGYVLVFDWFDGECLHSHWSFGGKAKYNNPMSPYYRFKRLDTEKRLKALDAIYNFHNHVEANKYVAVDFYDGSILYNFQKDEIKLCDIDFYRKKPAINDIGTYFWGSTRLKSPEEYELGAPIDSKTNVFNLGAMAFCLLGGELDRSFSKWEANLGLYEVAMKAVEEDRMRRYATVEAFYEAWKFKKEAFTKTVGKGVKE
ncbi:protein kinase domain-containing protein [Gracilibacillus ureilyticus]|nr:serine/threonine protein kinase [Gracilibacillus ureilyticus]